MPSAAMPIMSHKVIRVDKLTKKLYIACSHSDNKECSGIVVPTALSWNMLQTVRMWVPEDRLAYLWDCDATFYPVNLMISIATAMTDCRAVSEQAAFMLPRHPDNWDKLQVLAELRERGFVGAVSSGCGSEGESGSEVGQDKGFITGTGLKELVTCRVVSGLPDRVMRIRRGTPLGDMSIFELTLTLRDAGWRHVALARGAARPKAYSVEDGDEKVVGVCFFGVVNLFRVREIPTHPQPRHVHRCGPQDRRRRGRPLWAACTCSRQHKLATIGVACRTSRLSLSLQGLA